MQVDPFWGNATLLDKTAIIGGWVIIIAGMMGYNNCRDDIRFFLSIAMTKIVGKVTKIVII